MSSAEPTQADSIRLSIETDIFNGLLTPGTPLEEGRLATRFGVSRTPVREAIAQLVQAGLLTKSAHKRAVVSELDASKLLELFEALSELEGSAAFLSTSRMTQEEKLALADIHQRAGELLAAEGDPNIYAELGAAFHRAILNGCHNQVLIDATEWLALRVLPYRRFQVVAPGRLQKNQTEHDAIVDALLSGRAADARDLLQRHTLEQGEALMRFIVLHKTSYADFHSSHLSS